MLTLYQTEWCPFSSAVREVLTELGLSFVVRQVSRGRRSGTSCARLPVPNRSPCFRQRTGRFTEERERSSHTCADGLHGHTRLGTATGSTSTVTRARRMCQDSSSVLPRTDELEPAPDTSDEAVVVDVPEQNRYELRLDGRLIGLAAYRRRDGRIAFTHTEVDEECSGRGFGTQLVLAALDDARRQHLDVIPLCPFVAHLIDEHPEYQDLLETGYGVH